MTKYAALILILIFCLNPLSELYSQQKRKLRLSFHIFQDQLGGGNFQEDSIAHIDFLNGLIDWVNYKVQHLDTLKPTVSSAYVKSMNISLVLDTIYYHRDSYAWDCSDSLDSDYMRRFYVDENIELDYKQKHQTLPILFGSNYQIVGGHVYLPGSKKFIATRGYYHSMVSKTRNQALEECGKNLLHELGHAMGLMHNFHSGPSGDQCDECEDNGCFDEGTSNNIMDYWPSYGHAISVCQMEIIAQHLSGNVGNIGDVVINDSCYVNEGEVLIVESGRSMYFSDTVYLHQDLLIRNGAAVRVEGFLSMPINAIIRVEAGGTLIVQGGTLGNLCHDPWGGIVFENQSKDSGLLPIIEFSKGAKLENAKALLSGQGKVSLTIDSVRFWNNSESLNLVLDDDSRIHIANSQFEADKRYYHIEEGNSLASFVNIEGGSLEVIACTFYNHDGHRKYPSLNSGIGIVAKSADLWMNSSDFKQLYKGIVSRGGINGSILQVEGSTFNYCYCGIQAEYLNSIEVKTCAFEINRLNDLQCMGIYLLKPSLSILDSCSFFSEYGGSDLAGVIIKNGETGTNLVRNNYFRGLPWSVIDLENESRMPWNELKFRNQDDAISEALGTVLSGNIYRQTNYILTSMGMNGAGLVRIGEYASGELILPHRARPKWPVGGYEMYYAPNRLLVSETLSNWGNQMKTFSNHFWMSLGDRLSHITHVQLSSEYDLFKQIPDEYFILPEKQTFGSAASVEEWNAIVEKMKNRPWLARTEMLIPASEEDFLDWPVWALKEIGMIAGESSREDSLLCYAVLNLAEKQFGQNVQLNQFILSSEASKGFLPFSNLDIPWPGEPVLFELIPGLNRTPTFRVYPNPAIDHLYLVPDNKWINNSTGHDLNYRIQSVTGQEKISGKVSNIEGMTIDLSLLSSGTYIIELHEGREFLGTRKFLIFRD